METISIETTLTEFEEIDLRDPGHVLFCEGEVPRGVYVLRAGSVDINFETSNGEVRLLRVAEAGQLLGLSAVVAHRRHECSAVTRTSCEIGFIERDAFERALAEEPAFWAAVLRFLSSDVHAAYQDLRLLSGRHRDREPGFWNCSPRG